MIFLKIKKSKFRVSIDQLNIYFLKVKKIALDKIKICSKINN